MEAIWPLHPASLCEPVTAWPGPFHHKRAGTSSQLALQNRSGLRQQLAHHAKALSIRSAMERPLTAHYNLMRGL
jgi:hypothetical protein